jgi:hypothetical protein
MGHSHGPRSECRCLIGAPHGSAPPQNRFSGSREAFPCPAYRSIPLVPACTSVLACVHPRHTGVYAGMGGSARRRVGCGVAGEPPATPGMDLSAVSEVQKWAIRAILFTFSTDNPDGPKELSQSGVNAAPGGGEPGMAPRRNVSASPRLNADRPPAGTATTRPPPERFCTPAGPRPSAHRPGGKPPGPRPPPRQRGQATKHPTAAGYGSATPHGQQASPPTISTRIRQRDPRHPPNRCRTSRLDLRNPPARRPGDKRQRPSPFP